MLVLTSIFPNTCHVKIIIIIISIRQISNCIVFIDGWNWTNLFNIIILFFLTLSCSALCPSQSVPERLGCSHPLVCPGSGARHPCFATFPFTSIGHGFLGPCCGGMCPPQAPCPVTVSSYLSNPDQILSTQSSLSPLSLVQPWRQQQPSATPPWQPQWDETGVGVQGRELSVFEHESACVCWAIC